MAFVVSLQAWWRRMRKRLHAKRYRHAALRMQSVWRGRCGRQQAADTKLAKLRRQKAVFSLVQLWRKKVCSRVLSGQDKIAPVALPVCDKRGQEELSLPPTLLGGGSALHVKESSRGELAAAVAAMHSRVQALQVEAEVVRRQQEDLRAKAVTIQRWTLGGMLRAAARVTLRSDCLDVAYPLPTI